MIDASMATLVIVVLMLNSLAILGWTRKGSPEVIKIKGRRYL